MQHERYKSLYKLMKTKFTQGHSVLGNVKHLDEQGRLPGKMNLVHKDINENKCE